MSSAGFCFKKIQSRMCLRFLKTVFKTLYEACMQREQTTQVPVLAASL